MQMLADVLDLHEHGNTLAGGYGREHTAAARLGSGYRNRERKEKDEEEDVL